MTTAAEFEAFFKRLQAGVDQRGHEREDPTLLLDRIERHLDHVRAELERRAGILWGRDAPGGWLSNDAWQKLDACRKALLDERPLAAIAEAYFLGQAVVSLEVPIREHQAQVDRSRRHRKRNTTLLQRGLSCLLRDRPDITEDQLINKVEADASWTFDQDDIDIEDDGTHIVIVDLQSHQRHPLKKSSLSSYLSRARKPNT
jgi:hypothetical protein